MAVETSFSLFADKLPTSDRNHRAMFQRFRSTSLVATAALLLGLTTAANRAAAEIAPHVQALASPIAQVRMQAARELGRSNDSAAVQPLMGALDDENAAVRREAAKALGFLNDARAAEALIAALDDEDADVRMYAAYALGEIRAPSAANPLLEAMGDPAWRVRDQAAWALRELGDPALAGRLVDCLRQGDADVPHLTWLLRHLQSPKTLPSVAELLEDDDVSTRRRAVHLLGVLNDPAALEPLIAALADADAEVRRRAVEALRELGDERAKQPLQRAQASEKDDAVRALMEQTVFELSIEDDMAAWWSFDEANPETVSDCTRRGSDGENEACTYDEGRVGRALRLDGNCYVELDKAPGVDMAGSPLTVTAWVKSEADDGVVVARGGAFCGFSLYVMDGVPKFGIHRVEEGPAYIAAGKQNVVGRWVHLAGVIEKKQIKLYVDGQLAATAETPDYIPGNCGQGMEIGHDVGNSPAEIVDHFQGWIDEVKVYHAALSPERLADQASEPTSE
jgi:HEAT repeat protein